MEEEKGLQSSEVTSLHERFGFNELPVHHTNEFLRYLRYFWGPLPWLMELLIGINFFTGNQFEAWIICALLLINSGIGWLQRRSAEAAVAALTKHLTHYARVKRDGQWKELPARELLPADIIRVRSGDIVPADGAIIDGSVSVDLSSLTGESLPQDVGISAQMFSGSVIRRGEATVRITAIGAKTMYGKTTELLETSHPPTHMERVIFLVIQFFFVWNLALAVIVVVYGSMIHAPGLDIFNFVIVLLLTSVPIAFPTMFAVAQSFGALELSRAKDGRVLVRRLAAVQDFATVDVLCSDKTGTLTMNQLKVSELTAYGGSDEMRLLSLAQACSDLSDHDPIDDAIFEMAAVKNAATLPRSNFIPFNTDTKRTEVEVEGSLHVLKGMPELLLSDGVAHTEEAKRDLARMSAGGLRVVAVAIEHEGKKECVGLIGLSDPVRADAPDMLGKLRALGLRVVLITGDGRATAQTVADRLGLSGEIATPQDLRADPSIATRAAIFAETYPADKLALIEALQKAGHVVAMTGDGVNDAPALRQAEVGIAVSGATDVAKQSASFILTDDGLGAIVEAVRTSREVYSRLRTWVLNKIIKSFEVSSFTAVLFLITHSYIFSPLLAVLLLFANDFVTISIATDAAMPTPAPGRWKVIDLASGAVILTAVPWAALGCIYLLAHHFGYPIGEMRTVMYFAFVTCGLATLYAIRAWPHAWDVAPSKTLVLAGLFSLIFALVIAGLGLFTPGIPFIFMTFILAVAVICFFVLDLVKSTPLVRSLVLADPNDR